MSTSKSSRGSKPSRITVACNSCRSRKQKVSASAPICTQCFQSHRQCDWPEQLKRGPAKGYIEALEHRLHETEQILLRLLAHMTDEQLSIALERNQSPFLRSGKNDAQYWRRYPLRTACDLRKWQQDCFARTSVAGPPMFSSSRRTDASAQSEVEADEISPGAPESQQTEEQPVPPSEQDPSTRKEGQRSTQTIHGKNMNQHVAWENSYNPSNELRKSSTATGFMYRPSSLELIPFRDTQSLHAGTPPGPSLWSGAPSVAFQRQFLW
ncbi:transcription factor C6 [Aspergillus fumigatus]|nr:transcription factor C6 [Aspergillus fumigatus]